ncbi:MAG: hypothetical protein IPM29_22155 [Planctomycetes bacterium]|nr:hypothetical protein [Planctomycetota bacterium]
MTDKLRIALTFAAFGAWLLVVLIEVGSEHLVGAPSPLTMPGASEPMSYPDGEAVGWGIPFLAFVDGVLCQALLWRALSYVMRPSLQVKLQVIVTILGGILFLLGAIVLLFVALQLLLLMLSLVVAVPFGTAIYLARWGGFPTDTAAATLATLMLLRLVAAALLVIADRSTLGHKMLVFSVLLALLAAFVLSFLHAIAPQPFVAITDVLGAIVACVIGLVLGLIVVIGSLPALVKVVLRTAGEVGSAIEPS